MGEVGSGDDAVVQSIEERAAEGLQQAPQGTQKDFALWVQATYPKDFQAYLYAAKSGKDLRAIAYKHAFEKRENADRTQVAAES